VASLALVAGACGGSAGTPVPPAERVTAKIRPVAGCGARADFALAGDPAKGPARCDSGAPAPQPLAKKATVKIAMPSTSAEYVSGVVLAERLGEFAKEYLDVEIVALPSTDALPLVGEGKLDGYVASSFSVPACRGPAPARSCALLARGQSVK